MDFSKPKNQLTAAVALILGIADFTISFGDMSFSGIILGTVAAVLVYHLMNAIVRWRGTDSGMLPDDAAAPASVAVPASGAAASGPHPGTRSQSQQVVHPSP